MFQDKKGRIKLDDKFEQWKNQYFTAHSLSGSVYTDHERLRLAWDDLIRIIRSGEIEENRFGCHIGCGNPYLDCVLDAGDYQNCEEAVFLKEGGKTKIDCDHWKLIEEKNAT